MSDEVSLFALMDSHLSKTRLHDGNNPSCSTSDVLTPPKPTMVIPKFFPGNSPIKDFLAGQISITLKAKENRKQKDEQQREVEEKMKKLKIEENESKVNGIAKTKSYDEQEYVIDLTPAIMLLPKPNQTKVQPLVSVDTSKKAQTAKPGQSQLLPNLPVQWDKETCLYKPWDLHLTCTTDISYILKQQIKRRKFSNFGKVLCSRLPVQAFLPVHPTTIPDANDKHCLNSKRFDFKTKSPGDIFREIQRKPRTFNIVNYYL